MPHMLKPLLLAALLSASAMQAYAARASAEMAYAARASAEMETCFVTVGQASGVSPALLKAIARVESSLNPKAVNATHKNRTGSYDIGLMQINSRWLKKLEVHGITEIALYDACTSIEVGAWILADLFKRHGVNWEAVGAYNAACTQLNREQCRGARDTYIAKVRKALDVKLHNSKQHITMNSMDLPFTTTIAAGIKSIEFQD